MTEDQGRDNNHSETESQDISQAGGEGEKATSRQEETTPLSPEETPETTSEENGDRWGGDQRAEKTRLSKEEAREKVLAGEVLEHCWFHSLDLNGLTVEKPVRLINCKIQKWKSEKTTFAEEVVLDRVYIAEGGKFAKSQFQKRASFVGSTLHRCDFSGGQFDDVALFNQVVFTGKENSFTQCHFRGGAAIFEEAKAEGRLDFTGAKSQSRMIFQRGSFFVLDFADAVLDELVVLSGTQVHHQCSFAGAKCGAQINLKGANLDRLIFDRAEVAGGIDGRGMETTGEFIFTNTTGKDLNFREARFRHKALFGSYKGKGEMNFTNVVFSKKVSFKGMEVENLTLDSIQFRDDVNMSFAKIRGDCTATSSFFRGELDSFTAHFFGKCLFDKSEFRGKVNFDRSTFDTDIDFRDSNFLGETQFAQMKVANNGYFQRCRFHESTYFSDSEFSRSLFIKGVRFDRKGNFRRTYVDNVVVIGDAELNNVYLERPMIEDHLDSEREDNYPLAKLEFNILQTCFEQRGQHDDADWAYLKFKRMERRDKTRRAWQTLVVGKGEDKDKKLRRDLVMSPLGAVGQLVKSPLEKVFIDWGCGYGMKPLNITVLMLMFIFTFAFIYSSFPSHIVFEGGELGLSPQMVAQQAGFMDYLYFSVTTFTTMGFGDTHPHHYSLIKYIVALEAFLGIFLMAIFVGTMTRKIIR